MQHTESPREKIRRSIRLDRAVRFLWQAGPGWAICSLALLAVQGLLPLLALYLMKLVVDAVTVSLGAPDRVAALRLVMLLIGFAAVVAIITSLCQLLADYVREAQTLKITDHMYNILHEKSIKVDLQYYENPKYFDSLHRAQQEGPYRPNHILSALVRVGQSGVVPV